MIFLNNLFHFLIKIHNNYDNNKFLLLKNAAK